MGWSLKKVGEAVNPPLSSQMICEIEHRRKGTTLARAEQIVVLTQGEVKLRDLMK